jgi:6-pyruvoyltetrahydropterin/6-carboxytetrahydropterin synthase
VISVTRRYRFAAAHALRREDWTEDRNQAVYGKCANPAGHGHDYGLEVTVRGGVDLETGRVVDPDLLDRLVAEHVLGRFSDCMLNEDPVFERCVPTAENIARAAHRFLAEPVAAATGAELRRVRVRETSNNTFDYGELR